MSEPKRYEAMGPEVIVTPTGEFVMYEDYARLNAEVSEMKDTARDWFATGHLPDAGKMVVDHTRLQAEVERLTAFETLTIIPNEILQAQVEKLTVSLTDIIKWQSIGACAELREENAMLKAEVERLTLAGDDFVELLKEEGYSADIADIEYCMEDVVRWNAAKEGETK